jgi:hypothetical protein
LRTNFTDKEILGEITCSCSLDDYSQIGTGDLMPEIAITALLSVLRRVFQTLIFVQITVRLTIHAIIGPAASGSLVELLFHPLVKRPTHTGLNTRNCHDQITIVVDMCRSIRGVKLPTIR